MMIVSFSRLFTCLYGLTLLTLQTHLQLGLLGRDSYLSSIVSNENLDRESDFVGDERLDRLYEEQSDDNPLNSLTERRYLTFSYWYLHQGWLVLSERTRKAVEDILSSRNLKDLVSVSDLQEIFDLIRKSVELESDGTEFKYVRVSILDCSNIPPNKLPMI
jgi:peroxin-3